MTPKKTSTYNIPAMKSEMVNSNSVAENLPADENNSVSELSPKLLQTV